MKTVTDVYRRLNSSNEIPELQSDCICYSPDQMIWFGEQVIKLIEQPFLGCDSCEAHIVLNEQYIMRCNNKKSPLYLIPIRKDTSCIHHSKRKDKE